MKPEALPGHIVVGCSIHDDWHQIAYWDFGAASCYECTRLYNSVLNSIDRSSVFITTDDKIFLEQEKALERQKELNKDE